MTIQVSHGACTHVGQVRRDNEDAFVAIDGLYVVADGMGGHSAGEVASAITVATLKDAFVSVNPGLHSPTQVAEAIAQANTAVFIEALDDSAKSGMGTTLTGLVVTDPENDQVVVANVGDSRTYLWRGGRLQQITTDHSHVQTLVDRGAISKAEARVHYQRNIVLRAVGIDADVQVDLFPLTVENGDRFILCSDGLVDEADDDEIVNEIKLRAGPQELAERLVQLANDNGGRDNITVIVVDIATTNTASTTSTATGDTSSSDATSPAPKSPEMPVPDSTSPAPASRDTSGNVSTGNASTGITSTGNASSRDVSTSPPTSPRSPLFVTVLGAVALISALVVGIVSAL